MCIRDSAQGLRKIVVAVERLPCAEENIVVFFVIQHRVDGIDARHADRRRRQALVQIGVIRRFVFQMLVQDAAQAEILHRVFDRRVGLQGHSLFQPVDVYAGDAGHRCV